MKVFLQIWCLYIFCLAVMPCTDGVSAHTHNHEKHLEAYEEHHSEACANHKQEEEEEDKHQHEDTCSPFCICDCCHINVYLHTALIFELQTEITQSVYNQYLVGEEGMKLFDFLKPPKHIA